MAQLIFCRNCQVTYTAELRGKSCPACGEELLHARIPASQRGLMTGRPPHASRAVWDVIIKRDPCAYCACSRSSTVDHIQPKALGGSKGHWSNRTGSCFRCNQAKAHTPLLFFMLEQRGVGISHLKDEDGNWPIPMTPERMAELEEREERRPAAPRELLLAAA